MNHREAHATPGAFLREVVFGVEDGLISTLGIVAGVSGAAAGNQLIILAGLAGMLSGAISMAAGTYLSTKSQKQLYEKELARERWEVKKVPAEERREIREIYAKKGFRGRNLDRIVKTITSDKELWVNVMMSEELGLSYSSNEQPGKAAAAIALSFIPGGFVPIVPYVFFPAAAAFPISLAATMLGLLGFGAYKARFTKEHPAVSAAEMMVVGMLAAAAGYGIGLLFGIGVFGG